MTSDDSNAARLRCQSTANTITKQSSRRPLWIFPAEYSAYDPVDENEFQFCDVIWLADFGIFEKGEHCMYISVNFETGLVKEYDVDHMTRLMQFEAKPVFPNHPIKRK